MSEWRETEFGSIPSDWKLLRFGELLERPLKNGLNKPSRVRGSGYKMVNMNEIFAIDRMGNVPMELVPLTDNEKETSLLKKYDLLFARQSLVFDGAGKCSIFLSDEEDVCFEGHLIRARIDTKQANPLFYYYFFSSKRGKLFIRTIVEQAVVAGIRGSDLKELLVPCPPKSEQDVIAKLADTLDAKIDLLRRQNHTLEQIAQTLFNRWFVELEFPAANGQPYRASGGPMVDSELGEIPLGWRVGTFLELFDLLSGGTPKTSVPEYWDGEIKWISGKDATANHRKIILSTEKQITEDGLKNSATKLLPQFTTVISARGTVGCYCLLSEPMCMSQTNYGVRPKDERLNFFTYLSVSNIVELLKQQAYGTVFDTITTITFKQSEIVIPPLAVLFKFEGTISPFFQKKLVNENQIRTLTRLRDTLLPKLMSGQLRVNNE